MNKVEEEKDVQRICGTKQRNKSFISCKSQKCLQTFLTIGLQALLQIAGAARIELALTVLETEYICL